MSKNEARYLGIADSIKIKILSKIFKPGDLLPSENNLSEEYGVSRMTVRKAIEVLVGEGYLMSSPGKGTYVREYSLNKFEIGFKIEEIIQGGYTHAKLIHAKIMAPTIELVYHLQTAPQTKIVCIRSMLFKNDRPVALDEKYIPYFPGMNIKEDSFSYRDMVSIIFGENYGFGYWEEISITGVKTDAAVRGYFEEMTEKTTEKQKFMMLFEQKVYDSDDIPLGYGKLYVESDLCSLHGKSII
ncbi:MAG: GntR family transcriptional regulator [Eubacterium aggregans]|uniref:GntR family transcriptional regulator n=1 Tax=Eubacterium aggregans TaxID=81409 RepID=A0A1H3Z7X4_9FIRM|nr:GntR family transcriptional regulator [Eubacterium aggregans]MEA5072938.1 GntR family transcriptional regulator [Eubacterium aggregans]SEA19816.1 GntR family transcriptional regulator [Eubacterium aggregans]